MPSWVLFSGCDISLEEYLYGKGIVSFILACCFDTVFIPIRISTPWYFINSTVHPFLLMIQWTCDSFKRELATSNLLLLHRLISLFFLIGFLFLFVVHRSMWHTYQWQWIELIRALLESLIKPVSVIRWWWCTDLGPWGRCFPLCQDGTECLSSYLSFSSRKQEDKNSKSSL